MDGVLCATTYAVRDIASRFGRFRKVLRNDVINSIQRWRCVLLSLSFGGTEVVYMWHGAIQ